MLNLVFLEWLLALVLCCAFPLLAGSSSIMAKLLASSAKKGQGKFLFILSF